MYKYVLCGRSEMAPVTKGWWGKKVSLKFYLSAKYLKEFKEDYKTWLLIMVKLVPIKIQTLSES